ncbi:Fc receptor-like protein 5 [Leuresthes tenuis]|uniref:Fc receptor-like protein 5 n=1 Tax=Leuresthes tenuis TaxID=355514 RepID=UPI003B50FC38
MDEKASELVEYSEGVWDREKRSAEQCESQMHGGELKVKPTLTADSYIIPAGGSVTLTCSVKDPAGLQYELWRRTSSGDQFIKYNYIDGVFSVSEGGKYSCRGVISGTNSVTSMSDAVIIYQTVSIKATVILQPSWAQIFSGETVTARCEIQGGDGRGWEYEWIPTNTNAPTSREYRIITESNSREYRSTSKPRATLRAPRTTIPAGGSVALSCSVDGSDGWRFDWFRDGSAYSAAQPGGNNKVKVSQGGLYHCRGGRGGGRGGEPGFYTEESRKVTIEKTLSIKATVILQPSWPKIYRGETVTARCEIQGGGGTQWEYEWRRNRLNIPPTSSEHRVTDSGEYSCRGRKDQFHFTQWSDVITVTVSSEPRPVLTVSPSWLSPGASVTLSCQVEHPSAGWRFYWYKAVPDWSKKSYSYELQPDSNTGIEHDSYIIHGQTHTAGYVCRAGRGDPEYYTYYSNTEFVWSADLHPAASLTVSPDRVQHFRDDPVSLNCEGNSAEWRVMMITETGLLSYCSESNWGTINGSSCNIKPYWTDNAVYWCESGSGEFSNAVNITGQSNDGVILVSPVHPVAEGDSVGLSCRRREQNTLSNVFFYHNDTLLQSDSRGELKISAVSQSDEGFYKCEHSGEVAPQSWISVKDDPKEIFVSMKQSEDVKPLQMVRRKVITLMFQQENMMIRRIEEDGSDYYNMNPDPTTGHKLGCNSDILDILKSILSCQSV